jgi:hypothetical protein
MNIEILEGEIWKDIVGYEGFYRVSNFGRVCSLDRTHEYKNIKRKIKGFLLKQSVTDSGRLQIKFWKNHQYKHFYVHRLVALAFIPNPHGLPDINHKDLNPLNNHFTNLEWITCMANIHHYCQSVSKTGHIGITFEKQSNKFRVRMNISGKTRFIGRAKTIEEAILLRDSVIFSAESYIEP